MSLTLPSIPYGDQRDPYRITDLVTPLPRAFRGSFSGLMKARPLPAPQGPCACPSPAFSVAGTLHALPSHSGSGRSSVSLSWRVLLSRSMPSAWCSVGTGDVE